MQRGRPDQARPTGALEGFLNSPRPDEAVANGILQVRGWVFSRGAPVKELILHAPGIAERRIPVGLPRADVSKLFPRDPLAAQSGFDERVLLPSGRGPLDVELWALLDGGERVLAFARRVMREGGARAFDLGEARDFLRTAAQKAVRAYREGRLPASPRHWLRNLALHYREMLLERRSAPPPAIVPAGNAKELLTAECRVALRALLDSGARLSWPHCNEPRVSVILVLHNRAELTLRCLRSLRALEVPIELILVDNASEDETGALLERLDGARILRNRDNVGFTKAVNQAAKTARGIHLLLLNNDAELLPGSLESAVRTLEGAGEAGAVGGRLILPDGRLQEAGSIVWRDGTCAGYGRGDSPFQPMYAFERDVDYCSAAFLLTPRALFESLGGLDEAFAPAYYEDADYCVRAWKAGRRVIYDPDAVVLHYEFASSASRAQAIRMQAERRGLFAEKHAEWLARQATASPRFVHARAHGAGVNVLFLDDRAPLARFGSGNPRARDVLHALVALECRVTFYPTTFAGGEPAELRREVPRGVEVMLGWGAARLGDFLDERAGFYDCIVVSRPHNLRLLRDRLPVGERARVIYDAEALFAAREVAGERLAGRRVSDAELARRVAEETALARGACVVLSVSDGERRQFEAAGAARAFTLGHAIAPAATARPFAERAGLLFVGAFHNDASPNADALFWFAREVWPRLRETLGDGARLTVAGARPTARVWQLHGGAIEVLGEVDDLAPLYDRARVFVAPTRFAAGVPYKVHHAAAHGLPVAATSLLARQLDWRHDVELLAADDAAGFAAACAALHSDVARWDRLRSAALARVERDCSRAAFVETLRAALDSARGIKRDA
ncbi:MAG TPA: glycosyltransferase [Polyangia bacterium]|nr:glycosyltransferase [Polyangia bacterium]